MVTRPPAKVKSIEPQISMVLAVALAAWPAKRIDFSQFERPGREGKA
jgi:hypothetical protein